MTDICTDDDSDSDNENYDQQEIESYLYSLVHHGSIVEDCQQGPGEKTAVEDCQQGSGEETASPEDDDLMPTPAAHTSWRYFNLTGHRFKAEICQRFKRCKRFTANSKLYVWRKPLHTPIIQSNNIAAMSNKVEASENNVNCSNGINSDAITCQDFRPCSSNPKDSAHQVNSSISPTEESIKGIDDDTTQMPSKDNDEIKEDLNNTNPSLGSFDDCFEPPSRPKSKSALNESMTQALQVMLDEDASRSSIESSDKRSAQKSKASIPSASKPVNSSGWTVGMSWEDMSSKFRFNFEVDSVCDDSVREGSISASSRANTPEAATVSPQDVSKYDVSLKSKTDTADQVVMDIDNTDSEAESVIEVVIPEKEPPPIFELSSDKEDDIPTKEVDDEPQVMDEDIVILYETTTSVENSNGPMNNIPAVEINSLDIGTATASGRLRKRKLRKNKRNKRAARNKTLRSSSVDELNDILSSMSDDPSLWRLCKEDIYPALRKSRTQNFAFNCREPLKIKVCSMCSEPRHAPSGCPSRMCLNCGNPRPSYVRNCFNCSGIKPCDICTWYGHESKQCPDLWRRYHMTTNEGPPIAPSDFEFRSADEMWCCNCAGKGHISDLCPSACSNINERRLSHVVSYVDPTTGEGDRRSSNHHSAGSDNVPTSSNLSSQAKKRTLLLNTFTESPHFAKNCKRLRTKFGRLSGYPSQPTVLARFLEKRLKLLQRPVLSDKEVRGVYYRLMNLMNARDLGDGRLREAFSLASKLNMTVLGFGRLGDGNELVSELTIKIEQLRNKKIHSLVSKDEKRFINKPYAMLFKGIIRRDITELVNEYLIQKLHLSS